MHIFKKEYPAEFINGCTVIDDKYRVLFTLGSGRYSKVKMAVHIPTNQRVAIKIVKCKSKFTNDLIEQFLKEVSILIAVQHKKIVRIKDFQINGLSRKPNGATKTILYYTMGLAENGQLFRLIEMTDALNQKVARYYFRQLIEGLQHIHSNGIAHRDIKTENILIDKNFKLKIADFGFSCNYLDKQSKRIPMDSTATVGSPQFNAPQITNTNQYQQYYGDQADIFASGCVLFYMVMKHQPFKTSNFKDQYYKKFLNEDKNDFWKVFSSVAKPTKEFKDLIQKLLQNDPKKRIKLNDIKKHVWYRSDVLNKTDLHKEMQGRFKKIANMIKTEFQLQIKSRIQKYKKLEPVEDNKDCKIHIGQVSRDITQQILTLKKILMQYQSSDGSSTEERKQFQ